MEYPSIMKMDLEKVTTGLTLEHQFGRKVPEARYNLMPFFQSKLINKIKLCLRMCVRQCVEETLLFFFLSRKRIFRSSFTL